MNKFKKSLHILSWVPIGAIKIVLALFGLFVILPALLFSLDSTKWPKLFWLWGNQENVPLWWYKKADNHWLKKYVPTWWWYAIRNPVNNAQFIFDERPANYEGNFTITDGQIKMEPRDLIDNEMLVVHRWAWSGPFAGYRRVWLVDPIYSFERLVGALNYSEIWFGWKVGSTVPGLGFTMQVRLNREL